MKKPDELDYSCPKCGKDSLESTEIGQYCTRDDCGFDNRESPDVPEGGWPKGSDMDRI